MSLTVATLNLRSNVDEWERREPLIVDELAALRPHLIALQEVWLPIEQSRRLAQRINERLPESEPEYVSIERSQWRLWNVPSGREGIAILSRLPLHSSAGINLPTGGRVTLSARVFWGEQLVDFICTHLHHEDPVDPDAVRREQVRVLHAWLDERATTDAATGVQPVLTVLTGDFNATPETGAAADLYARWRSAYAVVHGAEPEWTFGTPLADRNNRARGRDPWHGTLDYIFVPPKTRVLEARLICNQPAPDDPALYPSDHVGVWAEVEVRRSDTVTR
jgi:endonuclease/exonuclease/phosphatase family metal-dependent hydrolase